MSRRTAHPSTIDRLGLAGWGPIDRPAPRATLGCLSGVLADFVAAPSPAATVPAQRTATLLEARR